MDMYGKCGWVLQRTFDVLIYIAKETKERCNVAMDCKNVLIDPDANQGGAPNTQQETWYEQHSSKNRYKCGNCDELGHNLRACPLPLNPERLKSWKPATWPPNSTPKAWYDQPPNPQRGKSGKATTPASKPKAWYGQVESHNKCGICDALGHNLRTCPLPLNPERSKSQKRHAMQSPSNVLGTSNHRKGELRNEFRIESRGVGFTLNW
ncbi:hypothetical protein NE237_031570 [Protea cynaroides]|uniref:CCHC-type domain-containing protein n=1 Tax=Protea cynaroides TaxID=273540 RepID=A0A9Q0L1I1_9MAGN|nr:hypothetical protein NE237_031570 [Protea cynaroides]